MDRRDFLQRGLGAAVCGSAGLTALSDHRQFKSGVWPHPPAYSVVPVVGDGKWIWNKPPEGETGYLEPRSYGLDVGIELEGQGEASDIKSTTTVPLDYPEQTIESVEIKTQGCEAEIRKLSPTGAQLILSAAGIAQGQIISAVASYKLTLRKEYQAYERDQFPEKQKVPLDIKRDFLGGSPGIQTSSPQIKKLVAELAKGVSHPWDQAKAFAAWVPKNIKPQIGSYTSVVTALETHRGDCEEMAGVFVALCRAVNIPARLVWIPNHTWAEFYLHDKDGKAHWIPAHTACYNWFGWNGAHELVLQKGDRIKVPERNMFFRLLEDWTQWAGRQPKTRYVAELTPLAASEGADPGPGARRKDAKGEWVVTQDHPLDKYMRR
jgi:hypothetical protein